MGERGDEWEFERIGTEREKMQVEKELQDLRERLEQVETWKARRQEIEEELSRVWVASGDSLDPPSYAESENDASNEKGKGKEEVQGDA